MSDRVWVVEIPMPSRLLAPNNRPFMPWQNAAKRDASRKARWDAKIAGLKAIRAQSRFGAKPKLQGARATIRRVYVPPAKKLDPDNLKAMLKSTWDGLQDAGLLGDDRRLVVEHPKQVIGSRPTVIITIYEV